MTFGFRPGVRQRISVAAARRFFAVRVAILQLGAQPPPQPDRADAEYRILLVCRGNICRSPLAHGLLRARLSRAGLFGRVAVDSAGTEVDVGKPPDPRARL